MTKFVYKVFEFISASDFESSFLHLSNSIIFSFITFYMNDFFDDFRDFENFFCFLRDYFFSKVE